MDMQLEWRQRLQNFLGKGHLEYNITMDFRETDCQRWEMDETNSRSCSLYRVWLWTDDWGSIPGRGKRIFPLASMSRLALGHTQPPVQWLLAVLPPGLKCGRGLTLTTRPCIVPRSRISRSYNLSPLVPPWCAVY
jgi:hypothetical protein